MLLVQYWGRPSPATQDVPSLVPTCVGTWARTPLRPAQQPPRRVRAAGARAGGHNVIAGLLDCLEQRYPGAQLLGFRDGPRGIVTKRYSEITVESMARLPSGRLRGPAMPAARAGAGCLSACPCSCSRGAHRPRPSSL